MFRRRLLAIAAVVAVSLAFQRCMGLPTLLDDETAVPDLVRAALLVSDMLSTSGTNAYSRLDVDTSQDLSACTDLYNGDGCTNGSRSFQFTSNSAVGCPLRSGLEVFGLTRLQFTSPVCDDGVDGTIDRTVLGQYFLRPSDGKKYLIYTDEGFVGSTYFTSEDLKNFRGEVRKGGSRLTIASGVRTLTISGVHQWSLYHQGYGFHHALYTEADQSIDVALAGPDLTLNGFATVSQDRGNVAYTVQFVNTQLNTSCRYPVDGKLIFYQQVILTPTVTPTPTPFGVTATPTPTGPTPTPTHTPTPTFTPTPGGPTPTPAPTAVAHPLNGNHIDVTFPGPCGAGTISENGVTPTPVELLP